jgi:16S rRNA (guanine966-N2)-methyltransferase
VPKGDVVRPTKDRVKASVFSALESRSLIEDAVVLDLYAGSGALGIEAVSRGAAHATLVDHTGAALAAARANVAAVGLADRITVVGGDASRFVAGARGRTFDLVFVDPPYDTPTTDVVALGAAAAELTPGGVIVLERPTRPQPDDLGELTAPSGWRESWRRTFGDTLVVFWTSDSD